MLGNLVRNLAVVVFVHALLEMLLPQGQFQRYLRLVTGLIVLLAVLNAFGNLLGRVPLQAAPVIETAAPDAAVLEQGLRLWRKNRTAALETYRAALQELIREEIEGAGRWRLDSAQIVLEEDPEKESYGSISSLAVTVRAGAEAKPGRVAAVEIEPVTGPPENAGAKSAGAGERVPVLEEALSRRLQLPGEIVTVICLD